MRGHLKTGLAFGCFMAMRMVCFAQTGIITTVAGNGTADFSGDGGPATAAQLNRPFAVAVDLSGNLYIADTLNERIRKVTAAGVISTVAGNGAAGFSGDGGPATAAQLSDPVAVAVDFAGNLYIADAGNHRIRRVSLTGIISTAAGDGTPGFSGDGSPATLAQLSSPNGVAVDSAGNLFISDYSNYRIRKVTADGMISTVAGNGTPGFAGDGGPATAAQLNETAGLAADAAGSLYIADAGNYRIRKVTPGGVISTIAGNGMPGFAGDGGPATAAKLNSPIGVAVDSGSNLYFADRRNNRIRKVTTAGLISTVAGAGTPGFSGDGGPAAAAQLNLPYGVAIDSADSLYIADQLNSSVRKVTFDNASDAYFPQVAVGGGYSTLFTIINTGDNESTGTLMLTDQQGNPLAVSADLTDSSGITAHAFGASAFPFTVPAGGTILLSATAAIPDGPTKVGWCRVNSTGGALSAEATYESVAGTVLQTLVGVLQSQPLQYATIPVDNNSTQGKQTAYAIANPGSQTISVELALVGQDGSALADSVTLTLGPGQQISRYLSQDMARTDFKGTLVLRGQAGASFIAVALVQKQSLWTVIPVIPGRSSGLHN